PASRLRRLIEERRSRDQHVTNQCQQPSHAERNEEHHDRPVLSQRYPLAVACALATGRRSRLSHRALTATRKLDPLMERAAISGRSTSPKLGSNTPAAIGSAMAL